MTVCVALALVAWCRPAAADPAGPATPADQIRLLPGFRAELVYTVPRGEQGSWVSLTVDDRGRLIASDQYGPLYRIDPDASGDGKPHVERLEAEIGMAQGLLYAFDSLYVMVNGNDRHRSGLYRLRDTNGDDQFDEIRLLTRLRGSGEHGPHAVVLSPDGQSLYFVAGNHTDLPEIDHSRVPRRWEEDLLLPRMWDAGGHAVGVTAPGGYIVRTDPEGSQYELISIGYRNQYDIAFSEDGELFTYDSDMEWDIGTPWYRPTRVLHATSGSEFGWRSGTGKWPVYYPDSLPAVVDVGPGSPTGVVFGTGAEFPERYQRALYLADWSYGIIYAAHLEPQGASYTATLEPFATAAPLPVTAMVINPRDQALYFTVGGRNAQSALYRVTYAGPPADDAQLADTGPPAEERRARQLRQLRRELESLHDERHDEPQRAVAQAWPHLAHEDRFVRYAARIALEHQPLDLWKDRLWDESDADRRIQAAIALARVGQQELASPLTRALNELDWEQLSARQRLDLLRAYQLAFIRLGAPTPADRLAVLERLDRYYPAGQLRLNAELSQLLAYLEAPDFVSRTLQLLEAAPTQEEQLHYALALRTVRSGWDLAEREQYFSWFHRAMGHRGGMSFQGFVRNVREEALVGLSDAEREALDELISRPLTAAEPLAAQTRRDVVHNWTIDDLLPEVEEGLQGRDFQRGRRAFAEAQCFKCHRMGLEGGATGPDLTAVGRRFNNHDLLESLLEPSRVVSDQYQSHVFVLDDGRTVTGRIINLDRNRYMVLTDMLDPSSLVTIERERIEALEPSATSMMPSGLLDPFTREEILDLIAYLRAGGEPDHELFADER